MNIHVLSHNSLSLKIYSDHFNHFCKLATRFCTCAFYLTLTLPSYLGNLKMATSAARELLSLPGAKSEVWNYFRFPAKDDTFIEPDKNKKKYDYCSICDKQTKDCGNTTNMRAHLEENHRLIFATLLKQQKPSSSKPTDPGQCTLEQSLQRCEPLARSS